ncbi:MAG TPA: aldehyde oxidase [Actinobacteria bacterium]|nr:xanthine dehydrogenase molybdenum-binding subunit [bacterium BMS3Bbin01]HDH25090.1 aldehyde oxidase [Actinomycetota bacterium]
MAERFNVVGHSEQRVDGKALITGKPVFAGDLDLPGMLHIAVLGSQHAHARIDAVDTRKAEALEGVALVLTHANTPTVRYTTAGQGHPEPSPYDTRMFDEKVRFIGDRVAAVAATSREIADKALESIEVDYVPLEPVLSIDAAMSPGAPVIHDELDASGIWDAEHNIAGAVEANIGNVDEAIADAFASVEFTGETQYAQHVPLEPHISVAYLDDNARLVLYTSTQVPFHVRRIIARVLGLPASRIRVIKPRIGGGFGVKQEILIEDLVGLVTLRTGMPSRLEYTRAEEFYASRTRHPMRVGVRLAADEAGHIQAIDMNALENTGAYGAHNLTVVSNTGSKTLPMYNKAPNVRFSARGIYTNLPVGGAYRGYGATQGVFPLETAIDMLAEKLGMDALELRRINHIRSGETSPIFEELGEGRKGVPQTVGSCGLDQCIEIGAERIGWAEKRGARRREGPWVHGVGMSIHMQGSGIPAVDMAAATIKMNDDGSFNLLIGATDLGTGSDTILAQMAAEVLGVPLSKVLVLSSDTDVTPFDVGAYASSTTYVSGSAVVRAAERVRSQIVEVALAMLKVDADDLHLADGRAIAKDGRSVMLSDVALRSLYGVDQFQIGATASFVADVSPPPFLASFAEVAIDVETGKLRIVNYVAAADCGTPINPRLAEGQVEGALANGIGYALMEEMRFDRYGRMRNPDLGRYKIPATTDMPPMEVILVETYEDTGPMGAKSIAEIGINAPIPTLANAIYDAVGVRMTHPPFTSEKIWHALSNS